MTIENTLDIREELETHCNDYAYVNLSLFYRRLNRILHTTPIRQAYHNASVAYYNVRRYELLKDRICKETPKPPDFLQRGEYLLPEEVETLCWRYEGCSPGRPPLFWNYICAMACHWMTQPNLLVAQQLFPQVNWSVASSPFHTTVISLEHKLLFDLNYFAMDVTPEAAIQLLLKDTTEFNQELDFYPDGNAYDYMNGLAGGCKVFFDMIDGKEISIEKIYEALDATELDMSLDDKEELTQLKELAHV